MTYQRWGETGNKYRYEDVEETITLVLMDKMVRVLRKTVWLFFKTLNIELLYDPAIPASKAGPEEVLACLWAKR